MQYEFPNRIWVNVSRKPNIRNVLLNNILKGRKFLLVLDNVWTLDAWNDIGMVLSESNNMSTVLITSCEKSVGEKATRSYELPLLTGQESWELTAVPSLW